MTKSIAAGAVAAAVLTGVAGAATGPATIRITDVQTSYTRIGEPGTGSTELVVQRLYNPRLGAKSIGRGALVCTYVDRRLRQCDGTYLLPRGKLVVAGALDSRLLFDLAVVGGTGLYDNARGSLTVTATGLRPRREILVFRLAG